MADRFLAIGGGGEARGLTTHLRPVTYLRKIADNPVIRLGDLHDTPRTDHELEVKLSQPCAPAQTLYSFLWSAETEEQGYLVTALDLSSVPKALGDGGSPLREERARRSALRS